MRGTQVTAMAKNYAMGLLQFLGSDAEDELFKQAGRAVIKLSDIENLMAMMFVILSIPVPTSVASELFYDQGTFERRMKLLNFIVVKWDKPKEVQAWKPIYQKLQAHRGIRNLIAHQGMFRHQPDDLGNRAVSLRAPWLKKGGKGRELKASDIKATGDALTKVSDDLWSLIKTLHGDS
jgi:hypothetical protein